MATSRISTELTEMPQSAVFCAISVRSTSSAALRSDNSAVRCEAPIISRKDVCATRSMARR